MLLMLVSVLGLHLPHYFAENGSPADYATYPGLILVAMMVMTVIAAVALGCGRRFGWQLGIGLAVASWALYLAQETGGLPGLSQTWYEPTRLASLLLAGLFVVLASRQQGPTRTSGQEADDPDGHRADQPDGSSC